VGSKPTNQTPSGVFDLAGNVWEWVDEPYAPVEEGVRVLRGGANGFVKDLAYRLQGDPNVRTMFAAAGIRCAASQVDESQMKVVELEEGVLYRDTFADPGSGWPVLAEGSQFFGYHPPDFYHIELSQADSNTVITRPPNFDRVTAEAEVRVDSTDTEEGNFRYGLALRQVEQDEFYGFTVSYRSESWQIFKSSRAGQELLAEGGIDSLKGFAPEGFTPDQSDLLRVDADGPNFSFFINGELVSQVSDNSYASGQIGFYVETFDESRAHVHYDALSISELQAEVVIAAAPEESSEPEAEVIPSEAPATEEAAVATETPEPESDTLQAQPTTAPPTASPTPEASPTSTDTPEPPTATPVPAPEEMVLVPGG
ncbi:MAG TPA: SUMF1/EgtB/PvdO family nonheme iron enzyme, partial [Desulfurivibrionaceae bacterium]|nr:SUMF1/EgtB/PvdO family nonheme iron enzyme [Desulfurivibrionaceae bacterium]